MIVNVTNETCKDRTVEMNSAQNLFLVNHATKKLGEVQNERCQNGLTFLEKKTDYIQSLKERGMNLIKSSQKAHICQKLQFSVY